LANSHRLHTIPPMLAEDLITALRRRWHDILVAVCAGLHFYGIDSRDAYVSGTPLRLAVGPSCEVILAEGPRQPQALIRCQAPGKGVLVASLDDSDAIVAADILECVAALHWRRQRRLDEDRVAVEAELADMVTSTGWEVAAVGGQQPTASFRSADDRMRGRVVRVDRGDGNPSLATFSVTTEISGLGYAETLGVLAGMNRASENPKTTAECARWCAAETSQQRTAIT